MRAVIAIVLPLPESQSTNLELAEPGQTREYEGTSSASINAEAN